MGYQIPHSFIPLIFLVRVGRESYWERIIAQMLFKEAKEQSSKSRENEQLQPLGSQMTTIRESQVGVDIAKQVKDSKEPAEISEGDGLLQPAELPTMTSIESQADGHNTTVDKEAREPVRKEEEQLQTIESQTTTIIESQTSGNKENGENKAKQPTENPKEEEWQHTAESQTATVIIERESDDEKGRADDEVKVPAEHSKGEEQPQHVELQKRTIHDFQTDGDRENGEREGKGPFEPSKEEEQLQARELQTATITEGQSDGDNEEQEERPRWLPKVRILRDPFLEKIVKLCAPQGRQEKVRVKRQSRKNLASSLKLTHPNRKKLCIMDLRDLELDKGVLSDVPEHHGSAARQNKQQTSKPHLHVSTQGQACIPPKGSFAQDEGNYAMCHPHKVTQAYKPKCDYAAVYQKQNITEANGDSINQSTPTDGLQNTVICNNIVEEDGLPLKDNEEVEQSIELMNNGRSSGKTMLCLILCIFLPELNIIKCILLVPLQLF